MVWRVAALALVAAVLAGCGEKPEPAAPRVTAVTGTVDLAKQATAPDAGTATGHRAPATASTTRSTLGFSGRVEPPSSRVTLRPGGGPIDVGDDGTFRARARKLKPGVNHFVLEGRSPGLKPWRLAITITRKG
jgi:hypothetical protein